MTPINASKIDISKLKNKEIPKLISAITKNLNKKNVKLGKKFYKKCWYWQYKQNPKKRSFVYVARFKKRIVGYYHIVQHVLIVNKKKYIIGNVQDVAVDDEFQGRGIFKKLSNFANSDVDKYVDALYSFPNKNSIKTFLKYDKFSLVDYIPVFVLPLKFFNQRSEKKLINSDKIVFFNHPNSKICKIFDKFSRTHNIHLQRNKTFLNWRYKNSPKGNFIFIGLMKNNNISALIVVKHEKIYKNDVLIILDFAFANKVEDLNKLISNFYIPFKKNYKLNASFLIMSGLSHCFYELQKSGFIKVPKLFIPRKLNLLARTSNKSLKTNIFNSANWLVTLGDWDIF